MRPQRWLNSIAPSNKMRLRTMKNFHSAYRAWMLSCLLALITVHMSWAQAPQIPNEPIISEYAKAMGTLFFYDKVKMGLGYCGSTYHDLAGLATKSKVSFELRHYDYVKPVEASRAELHLYIAENDGTSPRQVASDWEEKIAKSKEKTLDEWRVGLLQDWTKCLAFIEGVQRGQYDVKVIYPEIYQSVMARKESNSQKR